MQQYYVVEVATSETALPDFNYLIQYQNNYNSAILVGLGLIFGVLLVLCIRGWRH